MRCPTLTLLVPLVDWYPQRHDSHLWCYYKFGRTLIVRSGVCPVLTQYFPSALNRRLQLYPKSTATAVLVLPPNSMLISPPGNMSRQWLLPTLAGSNAIPSSSRSTPATTFEAACPLLIPLCRIFSRMLYSSTLYQKYSSLCALFRS
jgi:hypothetical protein